MNELYTSVQIVTIYWQINVSQIENLKSQMSQELSVHISETPSILLNQR